MRLSGVTLALVFAGSVVTFPQAPLPAAPAPGQNAPGAPTSQTPTRDRPATAAGNATIKGHVLELTNGRPIRGARITAFSGPEPPSADTDAEGRFELRNVRSGRVSFNVMKPGYLSLQATNGNKPIPPIEIKSGETIEKVVLRLARGGVIAGNVFDEFGDPYLGAEVRAMRYRYVNGRRELVPANSAGFPMQPFTDDLGGFRLFGLEAGEYYVVARTRYFGMPGGAVSEGPAPTYFPGTLNVAEARRVTVRSGAETQNIVFQLALAKLARVSGRVISSFGSTERASVQAMMREGGGMSSGYGATVKPDGTFEVRNLPPGSYELIARPTPANPGPFNQDRERGRMLVTVNGDDITDVTIAMVPGGTIRGRIVTDEGIELPGKLSTMNVFLRSVEPNSVLFLTNSRATVRDDATFELPGIFDRVTLQVSFPTPLSNDGSAPEWRFKSVLHNDQDVTDSGIEPRAGSAVENVVVVFTRKVTRLSGKFLDDRNQTPEGWVILFPADEAKWTTGSRYIRTSRPMPDGTYQMAPTPYDDYLIVGITNIEDGQWGDPDLLRALKNVATRIGINEGETKVHDVKLVEWRR